jgi:hypothetical protein
LGGHSERREQGQAAVTALAKKENSVSPKQRIHRRKGKPQLRVIHGSRELGAEEAEALSLSVSARFRAKQLERRAERSNKNNDAPERRSVAIAMLAVEERLVKAFWTIARQPARNLGPALLSQCGLDYTPERGDLVGYADAAGGKWQSVAPRPAIPSGKEIDDANGALDWLLFIDEGRRKILVAGATSKRGDTGRQISWPRLRQGMPEFAGLSTRTLQGRYRESLRIIVNELTLARLAK